MLELLENQLEFLEQRLSELEARLDDQSMQLDNVSTMGLLITSLVDIEQILSAMMEMATRMVSGEVGCIMLLERDALQTRISWGLDDTIVKSVRLDGGIDIAASALDSGQTVQINDLAQSDAHTGTIQSIVAVPIATHERKVGVLVIVNKTTGETFSEEDRARLQVLARFAAVAIENASLMKERLEKQKLEQELSFARQVQQALLPTNLESIGGTLIEAVYLPAGHVGGDYYDLLRLSDKEFVVIVGDVSNKGMPAALMMAATRSAFRLTPPKETTIDQIITDLNSFLCDQVLKTESMFISLVYAYFNLEKMTCTYVNSGHLAPIHWRQSSSELQFWKTGGTVLGQFPGFAYRSETVPLEAGDKILFYTDGVTECESTTGKMYGRVRLESLIRSHNAQSPQKFTATLISDLNEFRGKGVSQQSDDITTLMVEVK